MAAAFFKDMLLFSLQKSANTCVLYFAAFDTLHSQNPQIYRFAARRSDFKSFVIGGLYKLEIHGHIISRYHKQKEFLITDPYYLMLMELRALKFGKTPQERRFYHTYAYPFAEIRELIKYKEPLLGRTLNGVIISLAFAFAMLIPCALYVLLVYLLIRNAANAAAPPVIAVCALPLMLVALYTAYSFAELLLLKWPQTRYNLLRAYAMKTGGLRRQIGFSSRNKKRLVLYGAVSGGIFFLSLLFLLL